MIDYEKLKIIQVHHLSRCIPDQWELQASDGRQIYIRARHKHLTAQISDKASNDNDDAIEGQCIFDFPYDNYADKCGHLEIRSITAKYLDWSFCKKETCRVNHCEDKPK